VAQNLGSQAAPAHAEQDDVPVPIVAHLPDEIIQIVEVAPEKLSRIQPGEPVRYFPGIRAPNGVVALADPLRNISVNKLLQNPPRRLGGRGVSGNQVIERWLAQGQPPSGSDWV
jgi:hypothetical protein